MRVKREQLLGLGGALLLHLLLLSLLGIRLPESKPQPVAGGTVDTVIEARAVSEEDVMAPVRQREAEETERQRRIETEQRAAAERRKAEEQRKIEAQRKEQEEARRKTEAQRKAQEEAKRKAEADRQALAQRKAEEEAKQKVADEAKRKAEEQRKAEEAVRKKVEQERLAREEAQRREEEAKRLTAEQAMRENMAAEQRRLDAEATRARQTQLSRMKNEYVAQIRDKVQRNWLRPAGSQGTLCTVLIRQLPDGEVVDVRTSRCDGDAVFERSVENAVRRASPLPLPADRELFAREIEFNFRPN